MPTQSTAPDDASTVVHSPRLQQEEEKKAKSNLGRKSKDKKILKVDMKLPDKYLLQSVFRSFARVLKGGGRDSLLKYLLARPENDYGQQDII
jgi:hypothetical protein